MQKKKNRKNFVESKKSSNFAVEFLCSQKNKFKTSKYAFIELINHNSVRLTIKNVLNL